MAGLVGAGLVLGGAVWAAEKPKEKRGEKSKDSRAMERLPAAVRKTALDQIKGGVVRSISSEVEDGRKVYEFETTVDGRTKDMIIAADGTLMLVEDQVALDALPAPVRATIMKSVGKGKIVVLESVTQRSTLAYYEAQVRTGSKRSEIKVDPSGRLILDPKKP